MNPHPWSLQAPPPPTNGNPKMTRVCWGCANKLCHERLHHSERLQWVLQCKQARRWEINVLLMVQKLGASDLLSCTFSVCDVACTLLLAAWMWVGRWYVSFPCLIQGVLGPFSTTASCRFDFYFHLGALTNQFLMCRRSIVMWSSC